MALLVFGVCVPQDVEGLIEQLGSTDPNTREQAEAELYKIGPAALQALGKRLRDPDQEVRARIQRILKRLQYVKRLQQFKPSTLRITKKLKDEPVAKAIEELFHPFGVRADVWHKEIGERRISLEVKDVSLWQALDAFSAAADVHLANEYTNPKLGWGFRDGRAPSNVETIVVGDARLSLAVKEKKKEECVELVLGVALPPGVLPRVLTVEGIELVTESNKRLTTKADVSDRYAFRSAAGSTRCKLWEGFVQAKEFWDASRIRLRGTLVLKYARDLEYTVCRIADFKGPYKRLVSGVTFSIKRLSAKGGYREFEVEYDAPAGLPEQTFRIWYEDAQGRLFSDGMLFGVTGGGDPGTAKARNGTTKTLPAQLVIATLKGDDIVRVPFEFTRIPKTMK